MKEGRRKYRREEGRKKSILVTLRTKVSGIESYWK